MIIEIYFMGFFFFLFLYLIFAIKETKTFSLTWIEFGDIIFSAIFWFVSFWFILNDTRVISKRK